ncbi:MAG: PEGA domain-containing protein, partial [Desulfobacteraceae bacterium]|nr:PEGA domain-containing protein [Desulfobacteraceae bacterium]
MRKLQITTVLLIFLTMQVLVTFSYANASSAGKLKIQTSPEGASVFIKGEYYGRTPFKTRLYPGTYDVRLEKNGYESFHTSVYIPYKKRVEISHHFERKNLYGKLKVRSYPPGAEIFVDDKYYGETPESIRLKRGNHHIRLEKENYKPYIKLVKVFARQITDMEADLIPLHQKGVLKITSNPSAARVMINGSYYDKTPIKIKLRAGAYDIQLIKRGFKPLISKMKVRPGQLNHKNFKLKKKKPPKREGLIIVYSHPENAKIFIQNREMGKTPRKFSLPEGSHTIEIRKKGYKLYKKQVHITPWKTLYVNAGLEKKFIQRQYGEVHISSSPKGAKIVVDGKYYGRSPMSLRLVPGKHNIKITKRGFQTYKQRIRIKPFQSHYINAALVRVVPVKNYNGKI